MIFDWLHQRLLEQPFYANTVSKIREQQKLTQKQRALLPLLEGLGQLTNYPRKTMGDSVVSVTQLKTALDIWLPQPHATIEIHVACQRALSELGLTPYRFGHALQNYWRAEPNSKIYPASGGQPPKVKTDRVLRFTKGHRQVGLITVNPAALLFGSRAVQFLVRYE